MIDFQHLVRNIHTIVRKPSILPRYLQWQMARLVGRAPLLTIQGAKVGGFPNFSSYLGASRNSATDAELSFATPFMKTAKVILDVGGNFGVFAILFAKMSPEATVYTFEPNPFTAAALRENITRNNIRNVIVVEKAVGSENGVTCFANSADPATNRILEDTSDGIEVTVCTLESFCSENSIVNVDFLKIDVEGAELLALEGARRLFEHKLVAAGMIEVCPGNLQEFGGSLSEMNDFFTTKGYRLSVLSEETATLPNESIKLDNAGFVPI